MKPPGELISCALFALLPGVWKFALRLTVLPLTPLEVPCRGVLGTSPSSLFSQYAVVNNLTASGHTYHTCPHLWTLVLVDPAWRRFFAVLSPCSLAPMRLVWFF